MNRAAVLTTLHRVCSRDPYQASESLGGELAFRLEPGRLRAAVRALIDAHDIRHLSAITAQNQRGGVELLYHLWQRGGLTLRMHCPRPDLSVPSIVDLIPGADWYEREVHELFGVEFPGHPDLQPLLLPDDWDGPPPLLAPEGEG